MKVKMILPALVATKKRGIKSRLFPWLGGVSIAAYFGSQDQVVLQDENVEQLDLHDEPELVVIQVYISSSNHAYELADHYRKKGAYVCLGGLHVTSLPEEAAQHADSIFLGPGEDTWPQFLKDFRNGIPQRRYVSVTRTLEHAPPIRRDLIKRDLYLVPNSIVVSRGCPHQCDFCYVKAFFQDGRHFYTQAVDTALAEIERLPGRHVYFLDDHLLGNPRFFAALCNGMKGMGKKWQGASTVQSILQHPDLVKKGAEAGLCSLFVGFETLSEENLRGQNKYQNLNRDYGEAICIARDNGVMINGSFVFGMDDDDESVFRRTVEWGVAEGIETATYHIMTPYPGTALYQRMQDAGRLLHSNWDLYDTRHVVYQPARMSPEALETGYHWAYENFYRWSNIWKGAAVKDDWWGRLRHLAYAGGWKKFEGVWNALIFAEQVSVMVPVLERVLSTHTADSA